MSELQHRYDQFPPDDSIALAYLDIIESNQELINHQVASIINAESGKTGQGAGDEQSDEDQVTVDDQLAMLNEAHIDEFGPLGIRLGADLVPVTIDGENMHSIVATQIIPELHDASKFADYLDQLGPNRLHGSRGLFSLAIDVLYTINRQAEDIESQLQESEADKSDPETKRWIEQAKDIYGGYLNDFLDIMPNYRDAGLFKTREYTAMLERVIKAAEAQEIII
jgi:hypothetical protein